MNRENFDRLRPYLPNKNRLTGTPGWYTQLAAKLGRSEIWVQKAAKDDAGLHSDELDNAILELATETMNRQQQIKRQLRRFARRKVAA